MHVFCEIFSLFYFKSNLFRFSDLVPQRTGHLVDDGAQLSVLPGVADVGPGAERDEGQTQDHVAQAGDDVHAHEAGDAGGHVHDEDDHEQSGRRAGGVENVLGVIVLDVLDKHLVDLALQLLQVAAAELLASHLLHAAEHLQGLLSDGAVSRLQLVGGQERPVAPAHLETDARRRIKEARGALVETISPSLLTSSIFLLYRSFAAATAARLFASAVAWREDGNKVGQLFHH